MNIKTITSLILAVVLIPILFLGGIPYDPKLESCKLSGLRHRA